MLALLATACSVPGTQLPAGSAVSGAHDDPAILQGNDKNRWVTLTGVSRGSPFQGNVLAGKGVVYVVAGWGKSHSYESFATIGMSGRVKHAPRQPSCTYPGSTSGTYHMYAYDIALNHENNSVFMNPNITFSGSVQEFGWTFVSPSGKRSACYLADVVAGNVSVLANGPEDMIWGAGTESPYLWRFAPDGTARNFALPYGVTAFASLVEGPDHVLWAQPANAATVMRISPGSGKVLSTYNVPCASPVSALAVASGLVWGYANGCVYSITPTGTTTSYTVSGMVAQDAPHAMAGGPDGNPWFLETRGSAGAIGTIDPTTGKARGAVLPPGGVYGLALATGPDENIWVTDENDDVYVYLPKRLRVSPRTLTLPQIRAVARVTVTEPGVTSWKAASAKTSVARVKQSSTTPSVFLVTAIGKGITTVTVRDAVGNSVAIPVTVR
jgi:streptogramin lyase